MEQAFNFKLTSQGVCALGSPIAKTDGWPGSPAEASRPGRGQKEPRRGGTQSFSGGQREPSTLQAC